VGDESPDDSARRWLEDQLWPDRFRLTAANRCGVMRKPGRRCITVVSLARALVGLLRPSWDGRLWQRKPSRARNGARRHSQTRARSFALDLSPAMHEVPRPRQHRGGRTARHCRRGRRTVVDVRVGLATGSTTSPGPARAVAERTARATGGPGARDGHHERPGTPSRQASGRGPGPPGVASIHVNRDWDTAASTGRRPQPAPSRVRTTFNVYEVATPCRAQPGWTIWSITLPGARPGRRFGLDAGARSGNKIAPPTAEPVRRTFQGPPDFSITAG